MLAFSVQSEDYSRTRRHRPKSDERQFTASGLMLCGALFCLTYGLSAVYFEASSTTSAAPEVVPDPFLAMSESTLSKLRGSTAHLELSDTIQTGSTAGRKAHEPEAAGGPAGGADPTLHDRPSNGFEMRYPVRLVGPDLHIR